MSAHTIRLLIGGRVQGVGFRYFVAQEAARQGIVGFTRNLRNGRVEVFAQGDGDAVASFCVACGRGPHGAKVTRVDLSEVEDGTRYETFEIRRDE